MCMCVLMFLCVSVVVPLASSSFIEKHPLSYLSESIYLKQTLNGNDGFKQVPGKALKHCSRSTSLMSIKVSRKAVYLFIYCYCRCAHYQRKPCVYRERSGDQEKTWN